MHDAPRRDIYLSPGPVGDLEVYFEPCREGRAPTAVVCAPNPKAGGTMGHKVVHCAARALREAGFHSLRFNYRGVGKSGGRHGDHGEERDDVRAVLDLAAERYAAPDDEIILAGFSFGSWVGLPAGEAHSRVRRIIGIGLPLAMRDFPYAEGIGMKPLLVVQGREDEFATIEAVEHWVASRPGETQLAWIEAGHFFHGKLQELEAAIRGFATSDH